MERKVEIFMPIYDGNLAELMVKHKSQEESPDDAIKKMFTQILDVLHYIHSFNPPIIHRDVKPQNILFKGQNFYLTDFGIAKVADKSQTTVGTNTYMAPELFEDADQTPKVDIYAFGATIIECFEGFPTPKPAPWHQYL
jgi:serine/threonine protein kinase